MVPTRTRSLAAAAVAASALALVAGCGSSTVAPQQSFDNSISSLADKSSLSVTGDLPLSAGDVTALEALPDNAKDPAEVKARLQKLLPTSSIVITTATTDGKSLKDAFGSGSKASAFETVFKLGGQPDVDLRTIGDGKGGGALYLQAKVQDLETQLGGDYSALVGEVGPAETQLPFLKDALVGGWLKVDLGALTALGKQLAAGSGASPVATPSAGQALAAFSQLADALERDVKATRGSSSSLGDHLVLTANSRVTLTDLVTALKGFVPAAQQKELFSKIDPSTVPSRTVTLDAYVKDGSLSVLQLDLAQFLSGADATAFAGHHLPLRLTFSRGGSDVTAPATSTPVDVTKLLQTFGGLLGGSSGLSGGTTS